MSQLKFRPRARIIRTIGDQLISGPEAAVIELVKNAYDADASEVRIKFTPPLRPGKGAILVSDNGHGMDLSAITERWMEPATPSKLDHRLSPKNRIMMGSKGIGRFAAAKLGQKMSLNSIVNNENRNTEVLIPEIDWSIFSGERYLSDIAIDFLEQDTGSGTGTTIEIYELSAAWSKQAMMRLLLELRRLVSPVELDQPAHSKFQIFLDLSECTTESAGFSGNDLVQTAFGEEESNGPDSDPFEIKPYPLLSVSDYDLDGTFDDAGIFSGTFINKRGGAAPITVEIPAKKNHENGSPGAFDVKLRVFDREADALKSNMLKQGLGELSAKEARRILDEVAGVAVYRNGFRVRPYGDVSSDLLSLDKRRVQDPSLRIGNNQVAGYVTVRDTGESDLLERSSREGFEDNAAFRRLQSLIIELFSQILEPRRQQFRENAGLSRKQTGSFTQARKHAELKKIRSQILPLLNPDEQKVAGKVLDRQAADLSLQIDQLEERQRVLEADSSLGQIVGEVLHEGGPHAAFVHETIEWLARRIDVPAVIEAIKPLGEQVPKKLELTKKSAATLEQLFRSLRPLAGGKRGKPESFNPIPLVNAALELFQSRAVNFDCVNHQAVHMLIGYPGDLSTALINLIGNSVHWLEEHEISDPNVVVRLLRHEDGVRIFVEDNGPGIPEEFMPSIFDVGFSLKSDGTGLGLNIAREALARSGARLSYHPEFKDGARFEVFYPTEAVTK